MNLGTGLLIVAVSNVMLLYSAGLWNSDLHWMVATTAMVMLIIGWVLFCSDQDEGD